MKKFLALTACALAMTAPFAARAEYPEKPVEFVVPFPPGDLEDVLTRMIADEFQATYGVPAAVVNKPGGGGGPFPGAASVAEAPADGYTVGSFVIATAGDAPYSSIDELAAYAKDNDVALGHFGAPLVPTRVTFALAKEKGFAFGSDAAFDALDCNTLASGDADVINTTLQLILPCLDSVKVLTSIGAERIPLTPDAPTVGELAPDLNVSLWNGLFVHKDTPAEAREKIAAIAQKVIASDRARELAQQTGALIYWQDAAASAEQIAKDAETLGRIAAMLQ